VKPSTNQPEYSRTVHAVCITLGVIAGLVVLLVAAGVITAVVVRHKYGKIHYAVEAEDELAVRCFLMTGADVNEVEWYGESLGGACNYSVEATPLMLAADLGNCRIIEMLLDYGADIDADPEDGSPAIECAVFAHEDDSVELLLDRGAIVTAGALCHAFGRSDSYEMIRAMMETRAWPDNETQWADALRCVVPWVEEESLVNLLVELDADVNVKDGDGRTPLHEATGCGKLIVMEHLLKQGVNVNACDDQGTTPLHVATAQENLVAVQLLLAHGADANARDNDGWTPLHEAAQRWPPALVEALLVNGADLNARNDKGRTPLHVAAAHGHVDAAESLLKHGTDVNVTDKDGQTPLDRVNYVQMINLLRAHGAEE